MKFLAPLRLVARQRAPVVARAYATDPWTGPHATESEADVRADQDSAVHGKPTSVLQEETVEELTARTEESEYHDELKNLRSQLKTATDNMTDSESMVRADKGKHP